MKKMSKFDPEKMEYSFSGRSKSKGILMRVSKTNTSKEDDGFVLSHMQFPSAHACVMEDGSVQVNTKESKERWDEEEDKTERRKKVKKLKLLFGIIGVILYLSFFIVAITAQTFYSNIGLSLGLIFMGLYNVADVVYTYGQYITGNKEIGQLFRFHAAEHAAINAYNDLGRVPTLQEIKGYSNFSFYCSSVECTRPGWVYIGIGLCRLVPDLWFILALLIFLLFTLWAMKKNFYFTEFVCLSKPTDFEYEVAITAMTAALEYKEEVEKEMPDYKEIIKLFELEVEVKEENESQGENPDDVKGAQ